MKRVLICLLAVLAATVWLSGCSSPRPAPAATEAPETASPETTAPESAAPTPEEVPDGAATITFGADGAAIDGTGAHIVGDGVRIDTGGSYTLTGDNGHATVSVFAPGKHVQIVMNTAALYNGNGPALEFSSAGSVELVLADGTENRIETRFDEDGALHSEAPLTISGGGTLTLASPSGNAMLVRNNLTIAGGSLMLSALLDGIRLSGGVFTMNGGRLFINAQTNGINAQRDIVIAGGSVFSFGGVQNNGNGFLAGGQLTIQGGSVVGAGSFAKKSAGPQAGVTFEFPKQAAGSSFTVSDGASSLASFEVPGASRALLYSDPQVQSGAEYSLTVDSNVIATAAGTP